MNDVENSDAVITAALIPMKTPTHSYTVNVEEEVITINITGAFPSFCNKGLNVYVFAYNPTFGTNTLITRQNQTGASIKLTPDTSFLASGSDVGSFQVLADHLNDFYFAV